MALDAKCQGMSGTNKLCLIYSKIRYQDSFNEQDLNHLYEYHHDTVDRSMSCHDLWTSTKDRNKNKTARIKRINSGINSFCLNNALLNR